MKRTLLLGTVVAAMSVAPAVAQTTSSPASRPQQPTTSQSGTRTGDQSGSKADTRKDTGKQTPSTANLTDHDFIMEAAKGGVAEVDLGKLAADKASNPEVKQFGQKMADEHAKANDELKSLAQSKNILLPTTVDPKYKAVHDRLSKLSGEEFDRAYMQEMLKDHRMDVNEFRREARVGHDSDVKAWASKTLPTLQEHLKLAQNTNRAVATSGTKKARAKGTSGTNSNPGNNPPSSSNPSPR